MLKLKKIAVTGGLSAGKTTVCHILKELGAYVVSADDIIHQLLISETTPAKKIISLFGPRILTSGVIDRKKLAAIVFSNPGLLDALEKITHPAVFDEIKQRYRKALKERSYSLFVAEIPLLYETKTDKDFDAVIAVMAQEEKCKHRFSGSATDYDQRASRQLHPKEKGRQASYAIENNGSLQELKEKTKQIYLELIKT